jgi:hypothetical protein
MKTIKILALFSFLFISAEISAQRRREVVVVRHSAYRPAHIGVYHPAWHPHYDYHRRWVYFPRYNLYYDNWRNHYVYYNNNGWVSQPTAPSVVLNVDLSKERRNELSENDDDNDQVYNANANHKTQYK